MKVSTLFVAAALSTVVGSSAMAQTTAPAPAAPAAPAAAPAAPAAAPAAAAPAAGARVAPSGDIIATLTASGQFTTLLKALDTVNLTSLLKTPGPLTLFAPTDAAFAALPPGELDKLMADKAGLQQLLVYHIVNAKVDSSKVVGVKGPIPSAAGKPIYVDGSPGQPPKANDAVIAQTDLTVSNGVIYPVDHVLMPTFTPPAATAEATPAATPADEPAAKPAAKATARKKK